jgi:lactoylglutathione lyase
MDLLRKTNNHDYKYTITMMGYGPEDIGIILDLIYNYGVKYYDKGNAYAQIAIGTYDVYKMAKVVQRDGGKTTHEPCLFPGIDIKITACLDFDGWKQLFFFTMLIF